MLSEDKRQMRKRQQELRDALSPDFRREASKAIIDHIKRLGLLEGRAQIAVFAAHGSEVDLEAVERLASTAYPRVEGDDLGFYVARRAELVAGYRGILEPRPSAPARPELYLAPGLAFDRHGRRLGYGKGFYDRTLSARPKGVQTVGVAFSVQVVDAVPVGPQDQAMDFVVTEEGILYSASP